MDGGKDGSHSTAETTHIDTSVLIENSCSHHFFAAGGMDGMHLFIMPGGRWLLDHF
jgi:hypothetical protein